jgi:hypothetical protein
MERKAGRFPPGRSSSTKKPIRPALKERIARAQENLHSDYTKPRRTTRVAPWRPQFEDDSRLPLERVDQFGALKKRIPTFEDISDPLMPQTTAFHLETPETPPVLAQFGPPLGDQDIFLYLKGSDSLFHGCITDFQLTTHELEAIVKNDPGVTEPFNDGCRVAAGQQTLQVAVASLQRAVHFQFAALKQVSQGDWRGQFNMMRATQLLLHGLSRVHVTLIGETAEATEERKARAALRQYVPRDVIPWLEDQAFFRPGAGSGGLPGGPPTDPTSPSTPTEPGTAPSARTVATPTPARAEPPATTTPTIAQPAAQQVPQPVAQQIPQPAPQQIPQPVPQQIPIQILLQPPTQQSQASLTITPTRSQGFPLALPTRQQPAQQREAVPFSLPTGSLTGQRSSTHAPHHYHAPRQWTSTQPSSRSPGARPWPPRSGPQRGRTGDRDDSTRSGSVGRTGRN